MNEYFCRMRQRARKWQRASLLTCGNRVLIFFLVLSFMLSFHHIAFAVPYGQSRGLDKIIAVIPVDAPPTFYRDQETGKPAGFAVDMADEVASRAGFSISYIFADNWAEIQNIIQRGDADIVPGVAVSAARESIYSFSEPLEISTISFFVRAGSKTSDLKNNASVGVNRGSVSYELLRPRPGLRLVPYENFKAGLADLIAGKIDAFASPTPVLWHLAMDTHVEDQIAVVGKPIAEVQRAFGVRKDRTELLERLNKALEGFAGSFEYQSIHEKWYGKPRPYVAFSRQTVLTMIAFFLLIIAMVSWRHLSVLGLTRKLRREIVERKNAEESLRESEGRYRSLVETSSDCICHIDINGNFLYMNPVGLSDQGMSMAEVVGIPQTSLAKPEYKDVLDRALEAAKKGGTAIIEFESETVKGTMWYESKLSPKIDRSGKCTGFLRISRNITERKKMEESLRISEDKFRALAEHSITGICIIHDGKFAYVNPRLAEMLDFRQEEMTGLPVLELVAEPYRDMVRENMRKRLSGEAPYMHYGFQALKKDGSEVPLEVHGSAMTYIGRPAIMATVLDITERRKMEKEIIKARNLESLGILAGGIAHDFNNLLQGLLGNISMAKAFTPETSRAFAFLKSAEESYSTARGLTNQLIAFAKGGISVRETIQPTDLIREAVSFNLSGSNIKAGFTLNNDLLSIHADTGQLRQLIGNIVLNAREAMPSGGRLTISASNIEIQAGSVPRLEPGQYVLISIADNGPGIPEEILPRIFDPYFSTKDRGSQKGMGLGLTICDAIVKKHNGLITVDTEPGKGATFRIYLPAVVAEAAAKKPTAVASAGKGSRILFMDDEPAVYKIAVDFLEHSGYRADYVADGEAAIEAYKTALQAGDPYAVVILDLTIPGGMGGLEAIVKIREMAPGVKAIVSSGYANDPVIIDYASYGFMASLAKPYKLDVLKAALDRILL